MPRRKPAHIDRPKCECGDEDRWHLGKTGKCMKAHRGLSCKCKEFCYVLENPDPVEVPANSDIRTKAEEWARKHEWAFQEMTKRAIVLSQSRQHFSFKYLVEKLRDVGTVQKRSTEEYGLDNTLTTAIGRMIIKEHPMIEKFVETRKAAASEPT